MSNDNEHKKLTKEERDAFVAAAVKREREKTREEKAADIAYTINHSISCGITDIFVNTPAMVLAAGMVDEKILPGWMGWIEHIFENHDDHGHGHGHGDGKSHSHKPGEPHEHKALILGKGFDKFRAAPEPEKIVEASHGKWNRVWERLKKALEWKNFSHDLVHWSTGEVVGDVGGIVPTVVVQRMFPGFMARMQLALEPIAGGVFRSGAKRDAKHWAKVNNLAEDAPEVKAKEAELYKHEIEHLPQAVVWNVFSIPMNYLAQLGFHKWENRNAPGGGKGFSVTKFLVGKTFGFVFSNTVLIGGRGMMPELFGKWDQWNSKTIIKPTMGLIGGVMGVNQKTIDKITDGHGHAADKKEAAPEATPANHVTGEKTLEAREQDMAPATASIGEGRAA
jgi:hypothetical protein